MYSCASLAEARGCPIRKFTDQSLFAAPRNISQRTTSFIASQCQGIHQMLLSRLITLIIDVHPLAQPRQIGRINKDGLWKDLFSLLLIVLRFVCHGPQSSVPVSRSTQAHKQIPSFTMSISDTPSFYKRRNWLAGRPGRSWLVHNGWAYREMVETDGIEPTT